jgi:CheY-like chemotaxis protein
MADKAIICVDDEVIILESLKEQLEKYFGLEYIIEIAESADEGLEIIEEFIEDQIEIVIIVSDWLMPGMKGDEFLIKAHELIPRAAKVLLTGQAKEDSIEKIQKVIHNFKLIQKPWSKEELIETINDGLENE